jgi:REP element-mobilizing transposase RayT
MKCHFEKQHSRKSIRLKDYDYSQEGAYFVTICAYGKKCILGDVIDWRVELSPIGQIVCAFWFEIPKHFEVVQLDEFVVMPNHVHGIVMITGKRTSVKCTGVKSNAPTRGNDYYSHISPRKDTLSVIVRTYKSAVSRWCRQNGYKDFRWQRNYYEHVIRNEDDLVKIREYIANNAVKWDLDNENPAARIEKPA